MESIIIYVNKICYWIFKFTYLNLLWIVFSFLGLVVFGLFPATKSVFVIVHKWLLKENPSIFRTFWETYRKEIFKTNLLGYFFLLTGLFLFIDLYFFQTRDNAMFLYLSYLYIPLIIVHLLTSLFVFPIYVSYKLKFTQIIKNAFLLSIVNPISIICMVGGSLIVGYIIYNIPIFIIFFSFSPIAFIMMWSANIAFSRLDKYKQLK